MDTFHSCCRSVYFYPRPPRGGRLHHSTGQNNWYSNFYPRPPRGGRLELHYFFTHHRKFLSTPSARRATGDAESQSGMDENFYPRPPRGGRPETPSLSQAWMKISIHALREEGDHHNFAYLSRGFLFLSTPSARRATGIAIMRLVEETDFYPRPPRGGRLLCMCRCKSP